MIIGVGNDIIHISRIEASIKRFGNAFEARIFTQHEQDYAAGIACRTKRACYFAKRFAAKEACAKALGTGFRQGIRFQDIGTAHSSLMQPQLLLTGKALERLHFITPADKTAFLHLSLSDDYPLAQAVVIISAN